METGTRKPVTGDESRYRRGGYGTLRRRDAGVRKRLLEEYGIEIGSGLGPMAGKAWRIGLMGHGATVRNVDLVLAALRTILGRG